MKYGKKSITEIKDNWLIESSESIVAGASMLPRKIHTEESIEISCRADQDSEYIRFADEEERLYKSGKLLDAEFQIRRTPASIKRGVRYAIKKFTILDNGDGYGL